MMCMTKYEIKPYVKYIVLYIDMFQTEIVDEQNFDPEDAFAIAAFKRKYRDDCYRIVVVEII